MRQTSKKKENYSAITGETINGVSYLFNSVIDVISLQLHEDTGVLLWIRGVMEDGFWSKHLQLIVYSKQFVEHVGSLVGCGVEGVGSCATRLCVVNVGHDAVIVEAIGGYVVEAYHSVGIDERRDFLLALFISSVIYIFRIYQIVKDGKNVWAVSGDDKIGNSSL